MNGQKSYAPVRACDIANLARQQFLPLLKRRKDCGIVIGLLRRGKKTVYAFGSSGNSNRQKLDGKTIFEIASITKLLTATLLSGMVSNGQVVLDEPISNFLPESIGSPQYAGREITLRDLATHYSGLPRLPAALCRTPFSNPYKDYDREQLFKYMDSHTLKRKPGDSFLYSNLGYGLLGQLLCDKLEDEFEQAVIKAICKPLGMRDTRVFVPRKKQHRFAQGTNKKGVAVANWDFLAMAGCGALRSTVNDMLKFVAANLYPSTSPLTAALERTHAERIQTDQDNISVSLGWHILKDESLEIFAHDGHTAGYASFVAFNKAHHIGLVVLSNAGHLSNAELNQASLNFLKGVLRGCD